ALEDGLPLLARVAAGGVVGAGAGRPARARTRPSGARSPPERGDLGQPKCQDHRTGGPHGYDGAKKVNGRKRHLLVDTLGLLLAVRVGAGDVSGRDGGVVLVGWVARPECGRRRRWVPPGVEPPVVPRFAVVPRRWVVERTFAWLGRFRRL